MPSLRRLLSLIRRKQKAADLDQELRFHLETEADERRDAGASAADARRAARLDFGNVTVVTEDARATWGWTKCEQLVQDLRYAGRTLLKSRAFTATAVLSLALGIGANTLLFSFTDAILVRSLPVRDPESLVRMTWRTPKTEMHGSSNHASAIRTPAAGFTGGVFSYAAFELFQRHKDVFSNVFAYQGMGPITVSIRDQASPASGEYVSGDYFGSLGVVAAAGRLLDANDDGASAPSVAVVDFGLAQNRFGGTNEAVGQTCLINNKPFVIVGVAPRGFSGTDPGVIPAVYVPLHATLLLRPDGSDRPPARFADSAEAWLEIMARLEPGVSLEGAQSRLAPPFNQFTEGVKATGRWEQAPKLALVAGARGIDGLRRSYSTPLVLLMGLAGLILLLACANIANLLLARSTARAREIAVRVSLGAARARVIRQLLTESVVLSSIGGLLGVVLAVLGEPVVTKFLSNGQPNFTFHAELNWRVLLFACGLSTLTGLLFGVVPAIRATRTVLLPAIRDGRSASASASGRRGGAARALVVLQIGATLVLLVAAGLFARTLANYSAIDLGFNREHLLTVSLNAKQGGLDDAAAAQLYRELRSRFAAMPGTLAVGMSDISVLGDGRSSTMVRPAGHSVNRDTFVLNVGGGFFRALAIPLAKGRDIDEGDDHQGSRPVVVVSESFAREYFGNAEALGQVLRFPIDSPKIATLDFEIVGVARDVRYGRLLEDPSSLVYIPFNWAMYGNLRQMVYEIRTNANPSSYELLVRQIVHDVSSRVPVARVATQMALIDRLIAPQILLSRLCMTFAILALIIAVIGLYGTVAYDVSRRTREIGVRMALGAGRGQVVRLILGDVLILASAGIALGVPAVLFASKFAESYLLGVTSRDPITIAAAIGVLLAAALLASYLPARAASGLNPTTALRGE